MDILTQKEARVLGVLIEKDYLVPGMCPMSLHSIIDASNQRKSRMPRMMLTESEAFEAVTSLCVSGYAAEKDTNYSSRAGLITRYEHNVQKHLQLPRQAIPILGVLLLRGPLTPSQIRVFVERMHKYNLPEVEGWLRHMSRDRDEPIVMVHPLVEGIREPRWSQLLTGPVKKVRELLSISELMDITLDLQRRVRVLEEDALARSTD